MNGQYEVLNPWAEADPIPLRGISRRVTDLTGKTIGLFCANYKVASRPILTVVEEKLKDKFPKLKFSWFETNYNLEVTETKSTGTKDKASFEEWVKGVDAVIAAVGD